MKLAIFLSCLLALLIGAGALLLRTSQAPFEALQAKAPIAAPAPAPVAVAEVPATAVGASSPSNSVRVYSREEFRTMGEAALAKLPGREMLSAMKEADAYVAPLPLLKAADALKPIVEAVHADADLAPEAMVIYRTCASSGDYPDSVRALCLHQFRRLTRKSGRASPEGFAPGFIRELAGRLAS